MTPETATNVQSYELTEGRITRVDTERESTRPNGESIEDWMLRHKIPGLRDMHAAYWEVARRLGKLARANVPLPAESAESGEEDLYSFDALPDLDALAEAQGITHGKDASELATDFWPEGESVEDFIEAATEGRHEEEDESDS